MIEVEVVVDVTKSVRPQKKNSKDSFTTDEERSDAELT